jgi:hypothetical protein
MVFGSIFNREKAEKGEKEAPKVESQISKKEEAALFTKEMIILVAEEKQKLAEIKNGFEKIQGVIPESGSPEELAGHVKINNYKQEVPLLIRILDENIKKANAFNEGGQLLVTNGLRANLEDLRKSYAEFYLKDLQNAKTWLERGQEQKAK